ncbi:MAG: hypothetical protein CMN76_15295 [Spirochaetaceae bacterium]|nr:hypothetical protein [Spirochaetaceae bacterium]|tara:strand:- start:137160 stop:138218 length:1059 start_codon:yes stop_codon:yes gene_type:complete
MKARKFILPILPFLLISIVWYLQFSYTPAFRSVAGFESVSEIAEVEINGTRQFLVIRGADRKSPLLLVLHGGPGTPLTPLMRKHNADLEREFVVVYWEQRGAGKSYSLFMELHPFTLDQYVEDTRAVTNYLLDRFQRRKLLLLGHSWGSLVGLTAAHHYPDLYRAYIGVGQNIDFVRQESLAYSFTMEKAKHANDEEALNTLKEIGPPQHGRYPTGEQAIRKQRSILARYNGDSFRYNIEQAYTRAVIECTEYSWFEKALFTRGIQKSLQAAEQGLQPYNLFETVPQVKVPVYFVTGRHDANAAPQLVSEYFQKLRAPKKELLWLENSAHYPMLDEPEAFHRILLNISEASK